MKARTFRKKAALALILSLTTGLAFAQKDGFTKSYNQSFETNANTKLVVDNKYGNVDINDWEQKKIEINVLVRVDNVSKEQAQKILDLVNVEIGKDGDKITARTDIDDKMSRMRSDNQKLEINYTVNMPASTELDLSNKYGSVFVSTLTGHFVINVKYGGLTAEKLLRGDEKPLSEVNLGYSNANIEEAGWLKSEIKYSKIESEKIKALVLYSKYSHVFIDEVSSIVTDSKYDEFKLGTISNFVINTEYSNIKIQQLDKKLECNTKYTNCKIDNIPAGFESINIDNKYGGYKIGIDPGASYRLEGYASYAKIGYPDESKVSRISENTSMKVNGTVGSESNPSATVKVSTRYGGIRLDD